MFGVDICTQFNIFDVKKRGWWRWRFVVFITSDNNWFCEEVNCFFRPRDDKEGSRWESRNRKERDILQFFVIHAEQIASCTELAPSGGMFRIKGLYFLTQCSPYSHCESCAPSFRYSDRARCFAAAWWFRLNFPEPCASSGGRSPESRFWVFTLEFQGR